MATETRVFESVDNSPEAKAANAAYFAEQGITHEVQDEAAAGAPETPAAEAKPEAAAPATEAAAETEVDAETAAEWDSAQTDGKRKSRYAKTRQERREFKEKAERLERELAEAKAAKPVDKPAESKPSDTAAATPAAATPATFTEAEPPKPKYEDFANEDDQLLAYQDALHERAIKWAAWDRRREAFEAKVAAEQSQKTVEARTQQEQRLAQLNERVAEAKKEFSDFDDVIKGGTIFTPALQQVATVLPDGIRLAYRLAKDPAKLQQFNDLTKATQKVTGPEGKPVDIPTQPAYDMALFLLGQLAASTPAAPAAAPTAAPAAPSSPQPREEPPAPRPARGRASDEPRLEDLSGDARRDRLAKLTR